MKKKYLYIGLILSLIALGVVTFFLVRNRGEEEIIEDINNTPPSKYGMVLEKEYKADNVWEYEVTGQFPNPCYTAAIEEIVRESYPEQVTIIVTVSKPSDDMVCAQVISEYEHEDSFSASEQAVVKLEVID